ncbi:MAG: MotA/TolQ/ExbB proton channel family protein [Planctomycetes bacterium]|nr:MotA/TolQ/ExbB proton channel family protein [Planctomycetota bacterium]
MDFATIGGLVGAFAAVLGAAMLEGTHLGALFNLPGIILIGFGTTGATMAAFPIATVLKLPKYFLNSLLGGHIGFGHRAQRLVQLAGKARREGMLALEAEVKEEKDWLIKKGLMLMIDGEKAEVVRELLETEIGIWEHEQRQGEAIFTSLGGNAPTLGIIGTVLGLIHALGQSDPKTMAAAIGSAFMATLYGVGVANLVYLPIGGKLKVQVEEYRKLYEMSLEGLMAIGGGDTPRLVGEKLSVYLSEKERNHLKKSESEAKAPAGAPAGVPAEAPDGAPVKA